MLFQFFLWHPYDSDVGTFKDVPEVLQPLLIFLNSSFFILFWLNVYLFLLVQINLSPSFFPSLLVPYMFFFISLLQCLHFFLYFGTILNQWSILLTSVLNSPSDRLAISSSFSSAFGTLICYFIWAIFFVLVHLLCCKGRDLRYFPGWGVLHGGAICGGGVREGTMLLAWLSAHFQSFPPLPTSKLGPPGADSRVGGFVYILGPCGSLQRTLLRGWKFLQPLHPPQVFTV